MQEDSEQDSAALKIITRFWKSRFSSLAYALQLLIKKLMFEVSLKELYLMTMLSIIISSITLPKSNIHQHIYLNIQNFL